MVYFNEEATDPFLKVRIEENKSEGITKLETGVHQGMQG